MARPGGPPSHRPRHERAGAAVITAPADLGPGAIAEIASGRGVTLAPGLLAHVQRCCDAARRALRGSGPVYGVTTGLGALAGVRLTARQQLSHQRNLLLARATGGPPWLGPEDSRAVIAARLRSFLAGEAGVSAGLCERLAAVLNAGITPAVPRTGAGSAGEIMPLAHAFGPLAGIGRVLGPGGETLPAEQALRQHGLAGYALGPKEGIALLAGVPGAAGLSVLRLAEARELACAMEAAAALSVIAAGAPRDPYLPECARGDELLGEVLARLRAAAGVDAGTPPVAGEAARTPPAALQAPVSFRVAGPVFAHLHRCVGALEAAVGRALNGVMDSPAYLAGRFVGTAGFHGLDLAAHCDGLTVALAHAAEVSAARVHRLLDPRVTGLPAQLAARPGPDTGLVTVHKRAAGEVHALRRLAAPTPVGLIETSGGQEDAQSFGWEAAETLRQALRRARAVTSCEALTAYRALALRRRQVPAASQPVLASLAGILGGLAADRPFGEDIERLNVAPWHLAGIPAGSRPF